MTDLKCVCCNLKKEFYVTNLCKDCADKMDAHIEQTHDEEVNK